MPKTEPSEFPLTFPGSMENERVRHNSKSDTESLPEDNLEDIEAEPTEDEIRKQIFLPKNIENFKEPIKKWVKNTSSEVMPGWNKKLLPEEEIIRPADWRPPPPPRVDLRLTPFIELAKQEQFKKEECNPVKKEVTRNATAYDLKDLKDEDAILVMGGCGFVRMTKRGFLESKRKAEEN